MPSKISFDHFIKQVILRRKKSSQFQQSFWQNRRFGPALGCAEALFFGAPPHAVVLELPCAVEALGRVEKEVAFVDDMWQR